MGAGVGRLGVGVDARTGFLANGKSGSDDDSASRVEPVSTV